jgi:hypothetical protein
MISVLALSAVDRGFEPGRGRSLFVAIKLFTLQYSQMHLSNSKVFNTVLKTQDFLSSHWSRSVCQFSLSHAEGDNLVYHMG